MKRQGIHVIGSPQGHDSTLAHAFGHAESCPKCGCSEQRLWFCGSDDRTQVHVEDCSLDGEHLHRMCGACKYRWVERCLDQALLHQTHGEVVVEGELAQFLAAVVNHSGGLTFHRNIVQAFRGWVLHLDRDLEEGFVRVLVTKPAPQEGTIHHPQGPGDLVVP